MQEQLCFSFYEELRCEHFFPYGEWIEDEDKQMILKEKCNKCGRVFFIKEFKKEVVWGQPKMMADFRKSNK